MKWENLVRYAVLVVVGTIGTLTILGGVARAETLSWDAVTKYTDGTTISSPVTYTAYWTTDASLATGMNVLAPEGSSTSVTFDVTASGMPRGAIIYLTCKATVDGRDSAYAIPLSWNVPVRTPSAPANLRLN